MVIQRFFELLEQAWDCRHAGNCEYKKPWELCEGMVELGSVCLYCVETGCLSLRCYYDRTPRTR